MRISILPVRPSGFAPPRRANTDGSASALRRTTHGIPKAAVNEQGLFFDWASLPKKRDDVRFPSDKRFFNTYSPVKMLEECATVAEAIELYSRHNERIFRRSHIIIADKYGDSAIIEWGKDKLGCYSRHRPIPVDHQFQHYRSPVGRRLPMPTVTPLPIEC